jgi:phosphoglycerate dehydrogenase-like enzyme
VALTADFFDADGLPKYRDIGLDRFAASPRIAVDRFGDHRPEIAPEQLAGINGVVVLTPRVTAASLAAAEDLLVVSRFGVGYDSVDVAACTAADVVLCIATGAVDRPVAEATVGWMLALTHQLRAKDALAIHKHHRAQTLSALYTHRTRVFMEHKILQHGPKFKGRAAAGGGFGRG